MIDILRYFLLVIEAVCCLLLIGVILLQRSKGQGLGLAFGAGVGESLFGAQLGNVLTKTTVILAIIFLVNTTILSLLGFGRRPKSVADTIPATAPPAAAPVPSEMPVAVPEMPASLPEPSVEE